MAKKLNKKQIEAALKKIKVKPEVTQECHHKKLIKLVEATAWYQCDECGIIFYLRDIPGWKPEMFLNVMKSLKKNIKTKTSAVCIGCEDKKKK